MKKEHSCGGGCAGIYVIDIERSVENFHIFAQIVVYSFKFCEDLPVLFENQGFKPGTG